MTVCSDRSYSRSTFLGLILLVGSLVLVGCGGASPDSPQVEITPNETEQRVDVTIGGEKFTSYLYTDTLDVLKKPVLFPIYTADGMRVTRGYPIDPQPGDRVDHRHHIGHWFNIDRVNGLNFWGHSDSERSRENPEEYGTIRHERIDNISSGPGTGQLEVTMNWLTPDGTVLLKEDARFIFRAPGPDVRIIDRISTLTAQDDTVRFVDTKEGMFGIRVRRELEYPDEDPLTVITEDGTPSEEPVMDNEEVDGQYLSAKGVRSNDLRGNPVWGTRARWVRLSGTVNNDTLALAIIDHPDDIGYPTYWHSRGYGLFAANPLGQEVFTEGKESMNLTLAPGESETFRFRLVISEGQLSPAQLDRLHDQFRKQVE